MKRNVLLLTTFAVFLLAGISIAAAKGATPPDAKGKKAVVAGKTQAEAGTAEVVKEGEADVKAGQHQRDDDPGDEPRPTRLCRDAFEFA